MIFWCILIVVLKIFNFASDTVYKYVKPPNFFELPLPMKMIIHIAGGDVYLNLQSSVSF